MANYVRLYLIRHGHVQYFDEDQRPVNPKYAPLSERGRGQIRLLAQQLAEEIQVDQIYASTMPRSVETAQIIAKFQAQNNIITLDELREIKAGRLKEIPPEQAKKIIHDAYCYQSQGLKNFLIGESWQEFQARTIPQIEAIAKKHVGQQILISSHDAVNRLVIAWAYNQLGKDIDIQEQNYGALNIIDVYIEDDVITQKRVLLQNYTPYNLFKKNLHTNAVEDVYHMYLKTKGFQESLA